MIYSNRFGWRSTSLALLCLSLGSITQAAPPAAPAVTVGADIKELRFDWNHVPQANRYELWFRANAGAAWAKFGETPSYRPRITATVAAHLLDWQQARYQVRACNPSGCTPSASIDVAEHMFDTIGYFKASSLHNKARLGLVTAISEDGNTLAAFTAGETTPNFPKAAIYVYTRVGGRWQQQARIFPQTQTAHPSGSEPMKNLGLTSDFDSSLSLSADGNTMVAAMPFHHDAFRAGVLTIYRRNGSTWTQEHQRVQPEVITGSLGRVFGEINEAGDRILYVPGASSVSGVATPTEVLVKSSTGWQSMAVNNPRSDLANGYFCPDKRFSGDGNTIVWACSRLLRPDEDVLFIDNLAVPQNGASLPLEFPGGHYVGKVAVDYDGSTVAVASIWGSSDTTDLRNRVRVFRAPASPGSSWTSDAPIYPPAWTTASTSGFGANLALSRDGALLAVMDPADSGAGMGVLSPPLQAGADATGATLVYELRAQGPRLRRVLKPNNAIPLGGVHEGDLAFARNGKTLAVSEPDEPGNSPGIDGNRNNAGRDRTGAIWLY
jgi:hypothetical protein